MIDQAPRKLTAEEKVLRAAPPEVVRKLNERMAVDRATSVTHKQKSRPLVKSMMPVAPPAASARLERQDVNDLYRARVRTVVERFVVAVEKKPWSAPFRLKQAHGPMFHDPEAVDSYVTGTLQNVLRALLADELL